MAKKTNNNNYLKIFLLGMVLITVGATIGITQSPTGFSTINNNPASVIPFYGGFAMLGVIFLMLFTKMIKNK